LRLLRDCDFCAMWKKTIDPPDTPYRDCKKN
jgi:hypothetical protein